jgi:hypothetical protein
MSERFAKSTCCVPGCPRWSRLFPGEWMCARHWRMAPLRVRRALRKVWAALRDMPGPERTKGGSPERLGWARLSRLDRRLWAHAKRRVIFRAAGL